MEKQRNKYFSIYHMEKLEDINEIDEINNQVVIEENEDEIIKKTLEKLNE